MNFKTFIKKFKTNFSFRKRVLLIWGISIFLILTIVLVAKDTNLSASVLSLSTKKQVKQLGTCTDTDGWINYVTKGIITVVTNGYTRVEQDTCNPDGGTVREWFCGNQTDVAWLLRSENYVNCEQWCNNGACRSCNNPEWILACSLGLDTCDALCMQWTWTSWYGYGYGYNRTWGTYGYGYGYGYKKLDPTTGKPWMYLLIPFKTYTRAIYDAVVEKLWFQMVKSYNKKEFIVPSTK
jgi:hypothetical protein